MSSVSSVGGSKSCCSQTPLQEFNEPIAVTRQKAAKGDQAAIRKLAREEQKAQQSGAADGSGSASADKGVDGVTAVWATARGSSSFRVLDVLA